MGLTITNTSSLTLLSIINRTSANQANVLQQLSTGKRINSASDDPAGLIALENLSAELVATNAALDNNARTDSLLKTADGGIKEISSLLSEIERLTIASANSSGVTASELAANQAQIDNALSSIDRIVRTTQFNGKRLLDGTLAIDTAGITTSEVTNLRVFSRGDQTTDAAFTVNVTASAKHASATYSFAGTAATTSGATTVTIAGTLGTATITIASGQTQAQVVTAINQAKSQTGVSAIGNSSGIELDTTGYGTDEFVSVSVLSGGYFAGGGTTNDVQVSGKQYGRNASVNINGQTALVDGLDVNFNSNGISLDFSLTETFGAGLTTDTTSAFTVKATGGATFQLGTDSTTRATIGVDALSSFKLGGGDSGGFLNQLVAGGAASLTADPGKALKIVRKAISDVASAQGRLGGFLKFQVQTSVNSLNASKVALSAATSAIGDTDFAVATAELNRQNVLLSSGISLLGIANQQASQLLALLQ